MLVYRAVYKNSAEILYASTRFHDDHSIMKMVCTNRMRPATMLGDALLHSAPFWLDVLPIVPEYLSESIVTAEPWNYPHVRVPPELRTDPEFLQYLVLRADNANDRLRFLDTILSNVPDAIRTDLAFATTFLSTCPRYHGRFPEFANNRDIAKLVLPKFPAYVREIGPNLLADEDLLIWALAKNICVCQWLPPSVYRDCPGVLDALFRQHYAAAFEPEPELPEDDDELDPDCHMPPWGDDYEMMVDESQPLALPYYRAAQLIQDTKALCYSAVRTAGPEYTKGSRDPAHPQERSLAERAVKVNFRTYFVLDRGLRLCPEIVRCALEGEAAEWDRKRKHGYIDKDNYQYQRHVAEKAADDGFEFDPSYGDLLASAHPLSFRNCPCNMVTDKLLLQAIDKNSMAYLCGSDAQKEDKRIVLAALKYDAFIWKKMPRDFQWDVDVQLAVLRVAPEMYEDVRTHFCHLRPEYMPVQAAVVLAKATETQRKFPRVSTSHHSFNSVRKDLEAMVGALKQILDPDKVACTLENLCQISDLLCSKVSDPKTATDADRAVDDKHRALQDAARALRDAVYVPGGLVAAAAAKDFEKAMRAPSPEPRA